MSETVGQAVFLSYASQDADAARRLCASLRAAGLEVWFDQSELVGGDAWDQKIRTQIQACRLFLPVISANTQARREGYFRLEWKLAAQRTHAMADGTPFLLPIVIDPTRDGDALVPPEFRSVQWTRCPNGEAPSSFVARVADLLSVLPPQPTASAPTSTPPSSPTEPASAWVPAPDRLVPGTKWTLERKLGEGGFGEVWLARHATIRDRRVFKFCVDPDRIRTLKRELTLFRVLQEKVGHHPHIVRLLDVHFENPPVYLEMDYVEGQDLKTWWNQQSGAAGVPLATRLEIVAQTADALEVAHAAGVIHRDVKPGNILIAHGTAAGAVPTAKLADFGVGQVLSAEALAGVTKSGFTESVIISSSSSQSGTQLYMAPSLLAGEVASPTTDLYSLGVVLFQLAVGDLRQPLTPDWERQVADPVLRADLLRCFTSRPEERFRSAAELARSLRSYSERRAEHDRREAAMVARVATARRWKRIWTAAAVLAIAGLLAGSGWLIRRNTKATWARQEALPEIQRLLAKDEVASAFALAVEAEPYLAGDPALAVLWPKLATSLSVETTPPGAEVFIKEYRKPDTPWRSLGRSPLHALRVPNVYHRFKIQLEGHDTLEEAATSERPPMRKLAPAGTVPPGMVEIPSSTLSSLFGLPPTRIGRYQMDRFEVTNRQYQAFVDAGGYRRPELWKHPFVYGDTRLSWDEAMASFRDTTGQPGPATWKGGKHATAEADYPVTGVSWFEAAAYAEFAGKRLPSIYHWLNGTNVDRYESIVPLSNFSDRGLAPVGRHQGMSRNGLYDMAGNAKEWCWNATQSGDRYILGGGWSEPDYTFGMYDASSPFNRSALNGFRCIKLVMVGEEFAAADATITPSVRDASNFKPVNDETFALYRSLFAYDHQPLEASTEKTEIMPEGWRRELVSYRAAYDGERVSALVYLPTGVTPPYQAVIFFPGSGAISTRSIDGLRDFSYVEGALKAGRAVIYPVYKGTYERGGEGYDYLKITDRAYRDWVIKLSQDFGRSLDYLQSRPDIQREKIGLIGLSWGAIMGSMLPALEPRIKVAILALGGMSRTERLPEIDPANFAPRVTVPTLMLNGRFDFRFPHETSQKPLLHLLGTPPEQKRHVLFDTGHGLTAAQIAPEVIGWLDRHLGPVK
jgi:dienelactone hydrolase/tRNA A-37 threonylcarbamoyl transferase component Bud32